MQKYNATVIFTTGAPGTGKTYSRCARFLVDWWLPHEKGKHISNFPVNFEALEARFPGASDRVLTIPKEELDAWGDFESGRGPWSYFAEMDLQGAHIAIDEVHNFIRKNGSGSQKNAERWMQWLGELRHRGCTVEFLSQDPHKVHKCVDVHAAVRIQLVNSEDRRDPFFRCLMGDWYELRAMFSGEYQTVIWQIEERRINGKWVLSETTKFALTPEYFGFYDSFNTPHGGGVKAEGQQREFQKRGKLGVLGWFLWRNWLRLLSRLTVAAVVMWLCFGGGGVWCIMQFIGYVQARAVKRDDGKPRLVPAKAAAEVLLPPPGPVVVKAPADPAVKAVPVQPAAVLSGPPLPPIPASEVGVSVRSETLQHASLEHPPSGEVQQAALPRLSLVSSGFVALDDGQVLFLGDSSGEYRLESIDYGKRRAAFVSGAGLRLFVPVGGPVGQRLLKNESDVSKPASGPSVPGLLPVVTGERGPRRAAQK